MRGSFDPPTQVTIHCQNGEQSLSLLRSLTGTGVRSLTGTELCETGLFRFPCFRSASSYKSSP